MKRLGVTCFLSIALMVPAVSGAAERPAFQNVRYEESAITYKEAAREKTSALDAVKYMPLNDSESVHLSMGGQARLRWENWDNFNFDPAQDDDFWLLRLRLHGDVQLGQHARVFVELKSAMASDRDLPGGKRAIDADDFDVQNAFFDARNVWHDWTGTLRLGRQELSYGAQRLISPLDWANTRRMWDGGRVIAQNAAWRIDAFATRPVIVEKSSFNEPDRDQEFYGVYAVHDLADWGMKYDVYLLRLDRDEMPYGDDQRYTAGLRLAGKCQVTGIEYDVEGGRQFGDAGDDSIKAWFVAAEMGYTFSQTGFKPRVYLGFDYASGDDDPDDGDVTTFNQLFPLGHAYLGYIDVLGRQNVQDFSQGFSCWPVDKKMQLRADYHVFHRAERADAVYNVGGGVLREADAGQSKYIGSEVDVTLMVKLDRSTTLWAGYSRFFAGDFIKESGPSSDIDFVYASVQYMF